LIIKLNEGITNDGVQAYADSLNAGGLITIEDNPPPAPWHLVVQWQLWVGNRHTKQSISIRRHVYIASTLRFKRCFSREGNQFKIG
jgi:hypothetical protein